MTDFKDSEIPGKYQAEPTPQFGKPIYHAHTEENLCCRIWSTDNVNFHFLMADETDTFIEGDGVRHGSWAECVEFIREEFLVHLATGIQEKIKNGNITLQ